MALLKPCPFCYEDAAELCDEKRYTWFVECSNCKARGPVCTPYSAFIVTYETSPAREDIVIDAAIDSWNSR